jgi:hypothetical protein
MSRLVNTRIFTLALGIVFIGCLYCHCKKTITDNQDHFQFPDIDYIDTAVYAEIKNTCRTRWHLENMIDDTFEIIQDGNEYLIHCDGYSYGELYHFVIRADENGKWINDFRYLKDS